VWTEVDAAAVEEATLVDVVLAGFDPP